MFGRVRFQPLGLCGGVIGPPADFLITLRRNDSELPTARIDLFPPTEQLSLFNGSFNVLRLVCHCHLWQQQPRVTW
jgi:hypothetical protein